MYIRQARTILFDVRGTLLVAAGPSPGGCPGIDAPVAVSSLVVVSLDVFGAFVFALVISLLDRAREDRSDEHGERNESSD